MTSVKELEPAGTLPPGVRGAQRGELLLSVDELALAAPWASGACGVRIKWWGDSSLSMGPVLLPSQPGCAPASWAVVSPATRSAAGCASSWRATSPTCASSSSTSSTSPRPRRTARPRVHLHLSEGAIRRAALRDARRVHRGGGGARAAARLAARPLRARRRRVAQLVRRAAEPAAAPAVVAAAVGIRPRLVRPQREARDVRRVAQAPDAGARVAPPPSSRPAGA